MKLVPPDVACSAGMLRRAEGRHPTCPGHAAALEPLRWRFETFDPRYFMLLEGCWGHPAPP